MPISNLSLTVEPEQAGRVDLIVRQMTNTSRSQVRGMVDHGCVSVNKVLCKSLGRTVSVGDVVEVKYDPAQRYHEKKKRWDDRAFTMVFEDDHLIVVDKTAGVLTVPTPKAESNTLVDRVSSYISFSRSKREACVIHRLDRDVSGLLVFGKHQGVADRLIEQFKQRKPERLYAALVAGVVKADEGTMEAHLATGKNLDRFIAAESKDTERAITHFKVLKRMSDTTLVEARLETGKRNQIRVQFAHAGHPVLGDPRYRTEQAAHPGWARKRIALHAKTLGFFHPLTGEEVRFEAPIPSTMKKFMIANR
ncbi:Ribosomal large subunit pseudouridine synthase D [Roseimaritima multifibrata]|uniref:Pseudouridine synthase n=1 Tax=Roseimaritima multifibrata TaxID=1930274 RepID=A0A517MCG4_9BACT|nr:RluA family pseudouridine synthase [Roseimaritima multifibrata]QDS92593.1 Ribosomal large subunit pseudouridine synthase D [Roseimaritima multifibrata]